MSARSSLSQKILKTIDRRHPASTARVRRVRAAASARYCWIRIPPGNCSRAAGYSAANKRRFDWCPVSARCRDARHRACRPSAVPRFRDILPRKPHKVWQCRSQSIARGAGQPASSACPVLSSSEYARGCPAPHQGWQMNETLQGSIGQKNVKQVPYSTLPIFLTAATSRALSSATNLENSGASK